MVASFYALGGDPRYASNHPGLNVLVRFLSWQFGAAMLSLVGWMASKPLPKGTLLRWFARVPGWWSVTLPVLFAGLEIFLRTTSRS